MRRVNLTIEISKFIGVATLEVATKNKNVSKDYQIQRNNESTNEMLAKALKEGMSHLPESVEVNIVTKSGYLILSIKSLTKWTSNGFQNAKGNDIKYKEIWYEIARMAAGHTILINGDEINATM